MDSNDRHGIQWILRASRGAFDAVAPQLIGPKETQLAGGRFIFEDEYFVQFPFDGKLKRVRATFAPGGGILLGTKLLKPYRLTIDFPARQVWLERE